MNKQQGPTRIEWTDWTWNPVAGCQHGCSWTMPDGQVANCYAEDVADGMPVHYTRGFAAHYYHPSRLEEPLKVATPAKIFCGSMADVFGHWVPDEHINAILSICRQAYWHQFQFLTKNPPRLRKFDFPPNCWVGVSAPPSEMMGKPLTESQQDRWLDVALHTLSRCNAAIKWASFEPLSYDVADGIAVETWAWIEALDWVVIGAASRGKQYYQPDPEWVENLLWSLDYCVIPVFFKGNLHGNPAADPWREEFPAYTPSNKIEGPQAQQLSLFFTCSMDEVRDVTDELIHVVQANDQVAYMLCDFPAGSNLSARQIGRSLSDDYWLDHEGCAITIQFADGYKYVRLDFTRIKTWR